jgi:hypothetical protein
MLGRGLEVLHAYDRARKSGMKHSVAVREAADFVRQRQQMPVSETEVRRILAKYRPRNSRSTLVVDYSRIDGIEAENTRAILAHLQALTAGKDVPPPVLKPVPNGNAAASETSCAGGTGGALPLAKFTARIAQRPNYLRHNAKAPKKKPGTEIPSKK